MLTIKIVIFTTLESNFARWQYLDLCTHFSRKKSMLNVINEGLRGERGMDCTFQAPEEDGPGCHTASAASVSHIWAMFIAKLCLSLLRNISRNGQKCPKQMQQNRGSYTRESWVNHVCDWHVYQSLDVIGKSHLVSLLLFYMDITVDKSYCKSATCRTCTVCVLWVLCMTFIL